MINIHLDALKELIDRQKQAMSEAKSLYDYQKNLKKQTENLSSLRKQLSAYEGDTSEEAKATIQRLRNNLKDAEDQLKETQWDKYISETEKFLDDMYEDYEKVLNKRLENIDTLMHDMIGEVNTHGKDIKSAINSVAKDVAYNLTENAKTFLDTGTLASDFHKNFETYGTTIQSTLDDIKEYVGRISNNGVTAQIDEKSLAENKTKVQMNTVRNGVDYKDVFDVNYYAEHNPDLQKAYGNDWDAYLDHFIKYGMKEGRQAIETFNVKVYKNLYKDLQDAFGNDIMQYYLHYIKYGKKEKRKAYAGGSRRIGSNQLAWTQDGGGELIYRSSDGAILTPLNIGDKVFTNEMSENLWKLAQLKPTIPNSTVQATTNNINYAITLPNVTNYEEFKNALQSDPRFTGYLQEVTLGQANGNAKLNKRRY